MLERLELARVGDEEPLNIVLDPPLILAGVTSTGTTGDEAAALDDVAAADWALGGCTDAATFGEEEGAATPPLADDAIILPEAEREVPEVAAGALVLAAEMCMAGKEVLALC